MDDAIRYVGIISEKGNILHGEMKEGKQNLLNQKEQEVLSADLSVMRTMQPLYASKMKGPSTPNI